VTKHHLRFFVHSQTWAKRGHSTSRTLTVPRLSDYIQGVAVILQESGLRVRGANMLISSSVPMGGGLSSSAALEVASGYALLDMHDGPRPHATCA